MTGGKLFLATMVIGFDWMLGGLMVPWLMAEDFDSDWRFSRGDFPTAMIPLFGDEDWRSVNVPHDWSVEGPFSEDLGSGNGFGPVGSAGIARASS